MVRNVLVFASFLALAACGKVDTADPVDAPVTPTATLIVNASGSGAGTVTSAPAGISCGADCSEAYAVGTSVTLTAAPDASSTFLGWSGGGCSGTGPCTVTLSADAAVTAMFTMNNALVVTVEGEGTVTSSPAGINCGSDCDEVFPSGTVVTLTAMAAASSTFTGWSGAGCTGTATCVVTIDQARAVTATFALNRYALSVTRSGSGSGSVASTPPGISCGADCTEEYDHGATVTLSATAANGSTFLGWSGGGCTGTGDCTVTVTAITGITATFQVNQVGLTVMKAGNGAGTVTSSPAGINCGSDCSELYNFGTVVTLTATATAGSNFTGWAGGGCSGTAPCVVTVNGAVAVTATFTLNQYTLTVARAGTGTGTVTSSPAGISCGSDCTEVVNHGTTVTLTAAPASGSTFAGWSGGGCSGTGTCVVTVTAATTVTATFNASCPTGSQTFNYTGALQTFTVPACVTSVTIEARGAQGGGGGIGGVGGRGARIIGTVAVTGGSTLTILVGGQGLTGINDNEQAGGSGGGGSFVTRANTPLVIAGGGGGACGRAGFVGDGGPGEIGTAGAAGMVMGGAGGVNGGGGTTWPWAGWHSGTGGGGFTGDGINDSNGNTMNFGSVNTPGRAFVNGGAGGTGGSSGRNGGYGGGGAAGFTGAGGGGYSGGGSGQFEGNPNGGGGGSFNSGTNQSNTPGFQAGNGTVIITY